MYLRLDKWVWFARFFKSRALAQRCIAAGAVRVNNIRILDPSKLIKSGDILTINAVSRTWLVEVRELGERRGPAAEAQALYKNLLESKEMSCKRDNADPEA